jgi:23S rRNA (uracil1939-C5)-methyltransferase
MAESAGARLRIEKLVAGGDGLGFVDGKAVFVPFSLPGETVLARVLPGKRDFSRAELLRVLEPSGLRIAPPCPAYGECGGCNLQHLAYHGQLAAKSRIVAEAFSRTARIEVESPPCAASEPFGYRNRMQLHFTDDRRLGLMRRSSSEAIAVASCPVAAPAIRSWIEASSGSSAAYAELAPGLGGEDRFLAFGYGEELWLEGRERVVEVAVAGRPIRFSMKGFFQSNLGLLESFVPRALAGLSGELAADLYCGVGLFGSFLASSFRKIVCVEQNTGALELARTNVPGRGHEFHASSMEDWTRSASAKKRFDLVLVDPPRAGLAPAVRSWLLRSRPPVIVYVSCDPVTLARDSGELFRSGYVLRELEAFDFYPQTSHVECYARFSLR